MFSACKSMYGVKTHKRHNLKVCLNSWRNYGIQCQRRWDVKTKLERCATLATSFWKFPEILQSFQTNPGTMICNRTQPTFLVLPTFDFHSSVQLQCFLSLIMQHCPLRSYRMPTRHEVGHVGVGGCRYIWRHFKLSQRWQWMVGLILRTLNSTI